MNIPSKPQRHCSVARATNSGNEYILPQKLLWSKLKLHHAGVPKLLAHPFGMTRVGHNRFPKMYSLNCVYSDFCVVHIVFCYVCNWCMHSDPERVGGLKAIHSECG